uniref:caspase-1-like n=1 Tax=Monopterus albus TaxID=43700 RepID=UPI0009B32ED7|nr:caspase-1-like [Monopterus albus]
MFQSRDFLYPLSPCRPTIDREKKVSERGSSELLQDNTCCEHGVEDDSVRSVHKEKDFIAFLSSTPDTVSYRQRDRGSFLIQYIVEVFNTFAHKDDIEELFRKVSFTSVKCHQGVEHGV